MTSRRLFVTAAAMGLQLAVVGSCGQAQAVVVRRVGVLGPSTDANESITLAPFFEAMRRLGWSEGQNIVYDRAYADDRQERLPELAAALVRRNPEVIFAPAPIASVAAKRATSTVPIIFAGVTDPVKAGLVERLAQPGGNATGISGVADSLAPKRLELLLEILPALKRIGWLGDPVDPGSSADEAALTKLIAARGLSMAAAATSSAATFDAAVASLIEKKSQAVLTGATIAFNLRDRLIALASPARLPVVGHRAQLADAGALLSYSASLADQLRRSAAMVHRVLEGARPAGMPVEQPDQLELVVNAKSARLLGIALPRTIMLRAHRIIE